ncbi:hypothetical protein D4764_08G0000970 [Takifugu flavidus]|uniref:Uncharacterized protein n=1 Tax=Takifugu flavidus TaxID=433684 RepID=A0A5C6MRM7_9TELE|nr:hypothetical protein D4764_08G0000970 [Takifugu flavidus]
MAGWVKREERRGEKKEKEGEEERRGEGGKIHYTTGQRGQRVRRRGEERRGEERRGGERRRGEETMTQWGDRGLSGGALEHNWRQLALQAGAPVGNLHLAAYLSRLCLPVSLAGCLGGFSHCVLEDCFCLLYLLGTFGVFMPFARPASVLRRTPEFSAVQGDCFCWRTPRWTCEGQTPAVLEGCFCSLVLGSPGGLPLCSLCCPPVNKTF